MKKTYESFYLGKEKVGGIVRHFDDRSLRTLTCFQAPSGALVHLAHLFTFQESPFNWTQYQYDELHVGRSTTVLRSEMHKGAIPSYASCLVLMNYASDRRSKFDFRMLIEGDLGQEPKNATLQPGPSESITLPKRGKLLCHRVDLLVGDQILSRHWMDELKVVKSDWQGAESYAVPSLEDVTEGLDQASEAILRAF